jgi:methyl-accepting chemotaxis protein
MFTRMTVATRLYAGFALILGILVAVTLVAIAKVHTIDAALRANSEENLLVQRYAINFRGSAHNRSIAIRDVVLSPSAIERSKEEADINGLAEFYAQSSAPLERLVGAHGASPELGELYAGIKEAESKSVASTRAITAAVESGDSAGAQAMLWTQAKPQYVAWLAAINKLIDFEETLIQAANKSALSEAGRFVSVMLGALFLAMLVGSALAWSISRSIRMHRGAAPALLGAAAQRVSEGDLQSVPGASTARQGSVLASLGAMQASLSRLVGEVREASNSIATGSREIASGNLDLSQRTERQASNVQQTASSMSSLAKTVHANSATAAEANSMAASASSAAQKGGEVVGQVVATMEDIAASSKRISDIIGVIDGIAFQTNILALNAAVEAARAGEQGRGFAVVASEVRSLAQRSASAAREIKTLIGASVEKVDNGTRLVGLAGQTMDDIVGQVRQVSELIERISGSTAGQTVGIGHVGQAVDQLDQSTQQNAALVEQSAAAAESLRIQADRLTQTVSIFKLGLATS